MANGPTNETECRLTTVFGTCGECNYTTEQLIEEYPNGTEGQALEATAMVTSKLGKKGQELRYLVVSPHRPTCNLHTNQRECLA